MTQAATQQIRIGHGGPADQRAVSPTAPSSEARTPFIDIHDGADGLVLLADLPGASEGSVAIQLDDNVLSLHARTSAELPEGARPIHEEYRAGEFFRSFILSDEVDRSRISADLKDGVLRLTLPRAERLKPRRIEVKSQ